MSRSTHKEWDPPVPSMARKITPSTPPYRNPEKRAEQARRLAAKLLRRGKVA